MSLFNDFGELVDYVSLQKKQQFASTDFTSFKGEVERKINALNDAASTSDKKQLALASFAVYCWIDETIQRSGWADKAQWQQQLLQEQYFDTSNGGDLFFDKLEDLTSQDGDVVRVYYRCLVLGFRGKHYRIDDEEKLEHIKKHCLAMLQLVDKEGDVSDRLCSDLYASLDQDPDDSAKRDDNRWFQSRTFKCLWPIGALLIVFAFCFCVLYFTVHNYLNVLS